MLKVERKDGLWYVPLLFGRPMKYRFKRKSEAKEYKLLYLKELYAEVQDKRTGKRGP